MLFHAAAVVDTLAAVDDEDDGDDGDAGGKNDDQNCDCRDICDGEGNNGKRPDSKVRFFEIVKQAAEPIKSLLCSIFPVATSHFHKQGL